MGFFFTSDWHLTDKAKDAYRWEIFEWLKRQVVNRNGKAVFILGDITDAKNHHANELINRIVDELRSLSKLCPVHILAGNHDSSDPTSPLLRFLDEPSLKFYSSPESLEIEGRKILLLPNERSSLLFKQKLNEHDADKHDFVLMHQTFKGSIVSNGMEMEGFSTDFTSVEKTFWISGDVHVPQQVGNVIYCGAPHPVHFGDSYAPRVLFWDGKELKSIPRTTTKKKVVEVSTLDDVLKSDLAPGDHVKIVMKLSHAEYHTWEDKKIEIEKTAKKEGWLLSGFEIAPLEKSVPLVGRPSKAVESPRETFTRFCEVNSVPKELSEFAEVILRDII